MIEPGRYDIDNLMSGSDWNLQVVLQDSAGEAVDLTDYGFAASIWCSYRTNKCADITVTILDASAGSIELSLTAEETAALSSTGGSIGFWDLLVTQPSGDSYYWLRGEVRLTVGGSRPTEEG